ncbi:galactan 5-O-arabinofuranosyltransferase [Amycolatopsis arida]|uniref:Galactan 5-O-arabinofuranosyltransferase n=1 Tax=Amycolatopsis arida TaxID=587909 RepID=A0A1I5STU4_9PSEU|nr:arabinofuranosyltransferase [Amycolatopsis arida]TDX96353.1 galactan 5-O-arabinofuranosyltransferase [Amycolatopsis arida]SFP74098.1 galactan 5-O-arabinofuranosyltransferase [Amycolatopsis arida]
MDTTSTRPKAARQAMPGDWARPRAAVVAGELAVAVTVAAAASLAVQFVVNRMTIPRPSNVPLAVTALGSTVLLAAAVGAIAVRRWPRWATPLSWAGLAALGTLPLAVSLHGTRFYLNGLSGDQFFRTQYLARLTDSAALADGNYAHLPPFYPAGWFWVGGRFADLFGLAGWAAYKPFALLTMAVAPVVAFVLWSALTGRATALLLATLTCLAGLRVAAYEPYSWILAASIPPIAALAWRAMRRAADGRGRDWRLTVAIGLFFGASGAVYTLLFGFLGLVLVTFGLAAVVAAGRAGWGRRAARVLVELLLTGLIALPVMLLVWTPFLLRVLRDAALSDTGATRFLPEIGAKLPMPMFETGTGAVSGLLCLIGVGWIVSAWARDPLARALGGLVLLCYAWFLLSFLALGARSTLLPFRLEPVLLAALYCAGGLGVLALLRLAARWWPVAAAHRAGVAVVAVLAMVQLVQTYEEAEREAVSSHIFDVAFTTYDDTGHRADGQGSPEDPGAWHGALIDTIGELTGRPPAESVVLTPHATLLALRPYWGFQTTVNAYANPLADFAGRNARIVEWARARDAEELTRLLDASPYRAPDVFVLRRDHNGLRTVVSRDTFPLEPNERKEDVVFAPEAFAGPGFERRDVGPFAVIVRRQTP